MSVECYSTWIPMFNRSGLSLSIDWKNITTLLCKQLLSFINIFFLLWGSYDKFPDFFLVWAFNIIRNSSKFSMLLLYILWDDWPIFMISGSNEPLQQVLEYTLLKPDCQSWWISKMQPDTLEERYAIKFGFKLGKNAMKTYGMLQTAFRPSSINKWNKKFKEGRESLRYDEKCGRSTEVNTPELIGQRVWVRIRVTMMRF